VVTIPILDRPFDRVPSSSTYAPKVGPFNLSQARGHTSNRRAGLTILKWYYLATNLPDPCITIPQPDSLSQRPQRHPPPQDRPQRRPGHSLPRDTVGQITGAKNKPWSFRRHTVPSSGITSLNLRLGQFVDIGHSLKLLESLKDMKDRGLRPDILTYNSALELFGRHALEDEAWALVDDMKALGITPDIETYKFLLKVRWTLYLSGHC